MNKHIVHIVFHTHWDREWYYPFETYRYRLIEVMDRVLEALEKSEIDCFILDGQTLPLEDYLEVVDAEKKQQVRSYIKDNRLIIGPWYIAMDEFLVQGESIIRNLELGMKTSKRYGTPQKLGYIPDTFGHIGQMPQILRNFGIEDAMMWRGIHPEQNVCFFEGIDGSKLFTIFLNEGYYLHHFNEDDFEKLVPALVEKIAKKSPSEHLVLPLGGDHLMPVRSNLNERIRSLNEHPLFDYRANDYESALYAIKNSLNQNRLEIIKGEQRHNKNAYILPNVLSSRVYLKIMNQTLEDLLIGHIEPLMAVISDDDSRLLYLERIWEEVLKNQPHDSICGCSVDAVHAENEMRYVKAMQMIESLEKGLLSKNHLANEETNRIKRTRDDDRFFSVFNPHPRPYTGMVHGSLWLAGKRQSFALIDDQGHIQNPILLASKPDRKFTSPLDRPPLFQNGTTYHLAFRASNLRSTALSSYRVIPGSFQKAEKTEDRTIGNDIIQMTLQDDGTLSVTDKKRDKTFTDWHRFYAELDAGDSYNYSKPERDTVSFPELVGHPEVTRYPDRETLTYALTLRTPRALSKDRFKGVGFVTSRIRVKISLDACDSFARVETTIVQKAKDQRLRLRWTFDERIDSTSSDSAFEIKKRTTDRIEVFDVARQKEADVVVDPSLSLIVSGPLYLFHRGLHAYQAKSDNNRTVIDQTLIRSVGFLSRDDLRTRGGGAGPSFETPDAQCLGTHVFTYAFGIRGNKDTPASLYQRALLYRRPPRILPGYSEEQSKSIFSLENPDVIMTSLRPLEHHMIEVRLWNPLDDDLSFPIVSPHEYDDIVETRMDGHPIGPYDGMIRMKAHAIKTIRIVRNSSKNRT
jgi:mannosylglycerate hydrolase